MGDYSSAEITIARSDLNRIDEDSGYREYLNGFECIDQAGVPYLTFFSNDEKWGASDIIDHLEARGIPHIYRCGACRGAWEPYCVAHTGRERFEVPMNENGDVLLVVGEEDTEEDILAKFRKIQPWSSFSNILKNGLESIFESRNAASILPPSIQE